jgi:hypothetical protein
MTDEIIERTPCAIIYKSSDSGPPIPYPSAERPETPERPNRGFIDLRDRPDAAEAIFEATDVPGLQALLRAVNAPGSPFMSLGCERQLNVLDPPRGEATCYLNSYIEVTGRDLAGQDESAMIELAKSLVDRAALAPESWVQLELGVEGMKHFFGRKGGYCLHIAVSGFGRTKDEASATHAHGSQQLARAFEDLTVERSH